MKQVYSMYFSGTDTTKKVTEFLAGRLAEDLNRKKIVYDFTLPDARKGYPEFTEDDIVIFVTLMRMKAVFIIRRNWKKCMKGGQNRNFFFDEKSETRICRNLPQQEQGNE